MLHSTCCYFQDTLHAICELQKHELFSTTEIHHVLVAPGTCTYEYQLAAPTDVNCREINDKASVYLNQSGRSVHLLKNLLRDDLKAPLEVAGITVDSLEDLIYRDIALWAAVKPSVAAYLQWESVSARLRSISTKEWDCIQRFLKTAARYIDASDTLLEQVKPTHCLIFNGHFYRERVMLEICRRRGVSVLAIESCTFGDLKHVSQTGVTGNHNDWALLGDDWDRARRLNSSQNAQLDAFMRDKFAGVDNFVPQPVRRNGVRERLRIGEAEKVVVFFGQVPHDSVIVNDDRGFCDLPRAVTILLEIFSLVYPDVTLILRLHPGGDVTSLRVDHLAISLSTKTLPTNVRLISGRTENTYDIMELADVGITVSSQAGLEFLWLHKPLIVLGNAYYGNKGFTWDVRNAKELKVALQITLQGFSLSPLQCQRIDVFLFGLIFEYLVPFCRKEGVFTDVGCRMIANLLCGRARLFSSLAHVESEPYDGVK
jgi:hypothetical protein